MKRYVTAAAVAGVVYGLVFLALIIAYEGLRGRTVPIGPVSGLVLALSSMNAATLVFALGPLLLLLDRAGSRHRRLTTRVLTVVFLSPLSLLLIWLMFREPNETLSGLLSHIANVPGEFVINLIPCFVSVALFAKWLTPQPEASSQ